MYTADSDYEYTAVGTLTSQNGLYFFIYHFFLHLIQQQN